VNPSIFKIDDFPSIYINPPNDRYIKIIAAPQINGYENATVVVADIPPGGGTGLHSHPESDEIIYPMACGECTLGDEKLKMETGTIIIVPKGTEHEFRNNSEVGDLRIVCLFVPPLKSTGWLHDYAIAIRHNITNRKTIGKRARREAVHGDDLD